MTPQPKDFIKLDYYEALRKLKIEDPGRFLNVSISARSALEFYLNLRRQDANRRKAEHRRKEIVRRGAFCQCCGENLFQALTLDHVKPRAKGGNNNPVNIQVLCVGCNALKGDGNECPHLSEARRLIFTQVAA
jgi:hypothetical protein